MSKVEDGLERRHTEGQSKVQDGRVVKGSSSSFLSLDEVVWDADSRSSGGKAVQGISSCPARATGGDSRD